MRALTLVFLFLPLLFTQVLGGDTTYNVVTVNGKKGLKDEQGNFVISPKYDDIGWTNGSTAPSNEVIGYKKGESWGLINLNNQQITPAKYTDLLPFNQQVFIASIKGKFSQRPFFGTINIKGKAILDFKYYALKPANGYLIALSKRDNQFVYGMINTQEELALEFKYRTIKTISDHLVKAEVAYNKIHLFNTTSGQLLEEELTNITRFDEQNLLIQVGHLVGVLNHAGEVVVPVNYEKIRRIDGNNWLGKEPTHWKVLTDLNKVVEEIDCQELVFGEHFLRARTSEGEILLNKQFDSVTSQHFDEIVDVSGSNILFKNNNQYGVYNLETKNRLRNIKFDTAYVSGEFIYGARKILNKQIWSLYDTFGVKRTKFDYEAIKASQDRLFAVKRRGHWGFMDRLGKEVIHCVYDQVGEFKEGLVVVRYHGLYGVINKMNEWIVLPQNHEIQLVNAQLYLSKETKTTKLMSVAGELIYFTDNPIELISNVLIESLSNGQQQMISLAGVFVGNDKNATTSYEGMKYLDDAFIAVKISGKYGFVDKSHRLRITNRYEEVGRYSISGIPVKLLGRWGMINPQEEITVQPIYDSISFPINEISIVTIQNKKGLINTEGKVLLAPRFTDIIQLDNEEYLVHLEGKYGLVGKDGKQLINAKYDELIRLDNETVIVKKRDNYGTLTLQGVEAIPNVYDQIYYHKDWQLYFAKQEGEWKSIILN